MKGVENWWRGLPLGLAGVLPGPETRSTHIGDFEAYFRGCPDFAEPYGV